MEWNPELGLETLYHEDADGETLTVEKRQHVGAILDANAAARNSVDERARWHEGQNRVASIPLSIYYDLKEKGIIDFNDPGQKKLLKWLDDRDNFMFRTRPGLLAHKSARTA